MSERVNVFAYTAPGAHYPPYLSINREEDGRLTITVRGIHRLTIDHQVIELPLAEFRKMIDACRDEELVQSVGALIHGKAN